MVRKKCIIDKEDLHKLYVHDKKTIREIADIFNCSRQTVNNRLKKFNIPTKTAGRQKIRREDLSIDIEKFKKLYYDYKYSYNEMGRILGLSATTVMKYIKLLGLKKRKHISTKYHFSKKELEYLYINQGLSTYEIAKIKGCSNSTVYKKLKKLKIKRRKPRQGKING